MVVEVVHCVSMPAQFAGGRSVAQHTKHCTTDLVAAIIIEKNFIVISITTMVVMTITRGHQKHVEDHR